MGTPQIELPSHIGIIPDGNRRYAKRNKMPVSWGHAKGYDSISDLIKYFQDYDIQELSIYGFSTENVKRSLDEKNSLFMLMEKGLDKIMENIEDDMYRITFPGNRELLPQKLQSYLNDVESSTSSNSKKRLNVCLGYGGRNELVSAFSSLYSQLKSDDAPPDSITSDLISKHLDVGSDVDLLIRTSESRLSNFLIWQSSYAEVIFLRDMLWPEFKKDVFDTCLSEYSNRKRRYGK